MGRSKDNKIKKQNTLVRNVLERHSYKLVRAFVEVFPCVSDTARLIEYMPIEVKEHGYYVYPNYYTQEYFAYENAQEFLINWKRFMKLKMFL